MSGSDGPARALAAEAPPRWPQELVRVQAAAERAVGVRLFTVLAVVAVRGGTATEDPAAVVLARIYSSHPDEYPVGGEKTMPLTNPWPRQVVTDQQPYLGRGAEAIAAVFSDHEAIAALGCSETLNLPVIHQGRTLGVLNLLDVEGSYDDRTIVAARHLPALAVDALLASIGTPEPHHRPDPPNRSAP